MFSLCRDGSNDIHLESFLDRAEQAEVRKVVVRHADMTFIILTAALHVVVSSPAATPPLEITSTLRGRSKAPSHPNSTGRQIVALEREQIIELPDSVDY